MRSSLRNWLVGEVWLESYGFRDDVLRWRFWTETFVERSRLNRWLLKTSFSKFLLEVYLRKISKTVLQQQKNSPLYVYTKDLVSNHAPFSEKRFISNFCLPRAARWNFFKISKASSENFNKEILKWFEDSSFKSPIHSLLNHQS